MHAFDRQARLFRGVSPSEMSGVVTKSPETPREFQPYFPLPQPWSLGFETSPPFVTSARVVALDYKGLAGCASFQPRCGLQTPKRRAPHPFAVTVLAAAGFIT